MIHRSFRLAVVAATAAFALCATSYLSASEADTQNYFESIRKDPNLLVAFLLEMPKGGDLHNHLAGAIYAETMIDWAAEADACVDPTTYTLSASPCATTAISASTAYGNPVLYRNIVDAYSMRNWQLSEQSGHDHFFDAFAKYGEVTGQAYTGKMLAETARRASSQHEVYQELMFAPTGSKFSDTYKKLRWNDKQSAEATFTSFLAQLAPLSAELVKESLGLVAVAEKSKNDELGCATDRTAPGCEIVQRYIFQVGRGRPKEVVFAQIWLGFELAKVDPRFVGLNLVMPEDYYVPMHDFPVHMQMLHFLRPQYAKGHISLHAGELVEGLVPPEGLRFHVRDSVEKAGAERIGHGVDTLNETDALGLMAEMAQKDVMVEICLTSNDTILGVRGPNHPLHALMGAGVPVALATDDEGVARSDMTHEYLKGAEDQNLSYLDLKRMARTSLQHAFIAGDSFWSDDRKFVAANDCAAALSSNTLTDACKRFLAGSERARLQWKLEQQFREFEGRTWPSAAAGN